MSSRAPKIEIASTDHPARPNTELARALWRAASCMLAVLPMGMAVAHRSSPVFLGLAAALAILATMSEGRLGELAGEARRHLVTPLGIAALSFLGWTFISVAWSEFPATSLRALGEFWLSVAFALVLAISLPARVTRSAFLLLAISCTVAALMMLVELHTGMSLRRALQVRSNTFIFNRPMLTLMVLLPVAAAFLLRGGRAGAIAAIGLTSLAAFAIARSESGAAVLGSLRRHPGLHSRVARSPAHDGRCGRGVHRDFRACAVPRPDRRQTRFRPPCTSDLPTTTPAIASTSGSASATPSGRIPFWERASASAP